MPQPDPGEVWLVRSPFTDLTSDKVRPALVLAVHGSDVIVAGIFSRVPAGPRRDTWVLLDDQDADFRHTGLKHTSLLRGEKIAVLHESVLNRQLGTLAPTLLAAARQAVRRALLLDSQVATQEVPPAPSPSEDAKASPE